MTSLSEGRRERLKLGNPQIRSILCRSPNNTPWPFLLENWGNHKSWLPWGNWTCVSRLQASDVPSLPLGLLATFLQSQTDQRNHRKTVLRLNFRENVAWGLLCVLVGPTLPPGDSEVEPCSQPGQLGPLHCHVNLHSCSRRPRTATICSLVTACQLGAWARALGRHQGLPQEGPGP